MTTWLAHLAIRSVNLVYNFSVEQAKIFRGIQVTEEL